MFMNEPANSDTTKGRRKTDRRKSDMPRDGVDRRMGDRRSSPRILAQ
ncbi:hypothetical protein CP97_08465 [Aurantiacibacter atlanticus]|uniref:Uncharacterized protein n=1 Tax=Aurantiacibacter atlanticus TaxID=1648404 RepID=A0A0H4VBL7_9SPHN|nr:hypothetical protein CP97_08465 [Aurantiacibacter atlanticus]